MTRKFLAALLLGALSLALAIPAAASAAGSTEFGSNCTPNWADALEGSVVEGGATGEGGAPASGVITSWRLRTLAGAEPTAIRLQVWRPADRGGVFTLEAESEPVSPTATEATFPTRLPIAAGDHLGISTSGANPLFSACVTENTPTEVVVIREYTEVGQVGVGSEAAHDTLLPVVATIEPDADGDGFGDITQDLCPTDASTQGPCKAPASPAPTPGPAPAPTFHAPNLALLGHSVAPGHSVALRIASDTPGTVKINGSAAVGHGWTVHLRTAAKTLAEGHTFGKISLPFPIRLRHRLAELPPRRTVTLRMVLTQSAADGQTTTRRLTLHLRGEG
jgi:hypothetical protein